MSSSLCVFSHALSDLVENLAQATECRTRLQTRRPHSREVPPRPVRDPLLRISEITAMANNFLEGAPDSTSTPSSTTTITSVSVLSSVSVCFVLRRLNVHAFCNDRQYHRRAAVLQ